MKARAATTSSAAGGRSGVEIGDVVTDPADPPHSGANAKTTDQNPEGIALRLRVLGRGVVLGGLSGMVAGLIVGGVGSRIAMRISGMAGGDELAGSLTEGGNVVGAFSIDGTFGLLLLSALFFGPLGGLLYVLVRWWLPGPHRYRGLVFGALLLLTFGTFVVDPANSDFAEIGSPALNIVLFSVLFPPFGIAIAPITRRIDRLLPRADSGPPSRFVAAVYLLSPVLLVLLVVSTGPPGLIAAILVAAAFASWPRWKGFVSSWHAKLPARALAPAKYGAIVVFVASGTVQLARSIDRIL